MRAIAIFLWLMAAEFCYLSTQNALDSYPSEKAQKYCMIALGCWVAWVSLATVEGVKELKEALVRFLVAGCRVVFGLIKGACYGAMVLIPSDGFMFAYILAIAPLASGAAAIMFGLRGVIAYFSASFLVVLGGGIYVSVKHGKGAWQFLWFDFVTDGNNVYNEAVEKTQQKVRFWQFLFFVLIFSTVVALP